MCSWLLLGAKIVWITWKFELQAVITLKEKIS